jgi:hypothetical protein
MPQASGLLTQSAAAAVKRVSRGAVQRAIRLALLDVVQTGPYILIVDNAKFHAWDINRTRQRYIRRGFRRRRATSQT